jgi:hypothetical protein
MQNSTFLRQLRGFYPYEEAACSSPRGRHASPAPTANTTCQQAGVRYNGTGGISVHDGRILAYDGRRASSKFSYRRIYQFCRLWSQLVEATRGSLGGSKTLTPAATNRHGETLMPKARFSAHADSGSEYCGILSNSPFLSAD